MQYLDRPQYGVDHVEQQDGVTRISCQLPVDAWQVASQRGEPILPEHRPFVAREFEWRDAEQTLIVHDRPRRSPDGQVTWTIHVLATHARRIDDTTVEMNITDTSARLVVKMPHAPLSLALEPCGCTLRSPIRRHLSTSASSMCNCKAQPCLPITTSSRMPARYIRQP